MSTRQLADRLGVTQSTASKLEASEAAGTIQLSSLARAADALGCTVVYALVPNESLEVMIERQARAVATDELGAVDVTMALEGQRVGIDQGLLDEYAAALV